MPRNTTVFNQKIQSSTQEGPMNRAIQRGCLKLVTISCYNVTTLQHLFVVTNTVTTFISCNSIISTHNCYIQIFVVISKYLLLQRQRKVVTQIFVVTMSGICSDKSRGRGTFGSSSPPPSPTPSPWVCDVASRIYAVFL